MALNYKWFVLFAMILISRFHDSVAAGIGSTQTGGPDSRTEAAGVVQLTHTSAGWCMDTLQRSVHTHGDVWVSEHTPAEDELDRLMVNVTECKYEALSLGGHSTLPARPYDADSGLQWRGALRARDRAAIQIGTDKFSYIFRIGDDDNTKTTIYHWYSVELEVPTPGILSGERYVPFYVTLSGGRLTFGRECERKALFSRAVSVARGDMVAISFWSSSDYGGKFLYNCPPRGA